ncbi:unnamed protein product, partial [Effrenium voratum]
DEDGNPLKSAIAFVSGAARCQLAVIGSLMAMLDGNKSAADSVVRRPEGGSIVQQLGRTPIEAQQGLPIYSLGPFPRCTKESDLRNRSRHVTVITTAALPWT